MKKFEQIVKVLFFSIVFLGTVFSCGSEGDVQEDSLHETSSDNSSVGVINVQGKDVSDIDFDTTFDKTINAKTQSNTVKEASYLSRAKYSFENNLLDSSGNDYHAQIVSGQVVYEQGSYGQVAYLNESWLEVPNSSNFNFERTDSLCFEFWVKRTYLKDEENVISRMEHADGNPESKDMKGWKIYFEDNGKVTFLLRHSWESNDHKNLLMAQTIKRFAKKNRWYHIEISYDGSSDVSGVEIKIDGEVQTINAIHNNLSGSILSDAPLIIGGPNNLSAPLNGYIDELEINMDCYSHPCDGVVCGTNAHCEIVGESSACLCDAGYTEELDDGTCINEKVVDCTDVAPENATSVITQSTITYTDANGWTAIPECSWECNTDFISEDGSTCINNKLTQCLDVSPENATTFSILVPVTYSDAEGWSTPADCAWGCNPDYISENGETCINSKSVPCANTSPQFSAPTITNVTVTYTTASGWSDPQSCEWQCLTDYISEDGETCINSKLVDCVENAPANATATTAPVTINYTTTSGWSSPTECVWTCNTDYVSEDEATCINHKLVLCTDNAPENASSELLDINITFTTIDGWSEIPVCDWACDTDFISEDGSTCINSKQIDCTDNAPVNATSVVAPVTVTYTTSTGWTIPSECVWNCNIDYISEDGSTCINSKQIDCTDNAPINATSDIQSVTVTYTTVAGWTTPSECAWNCNEGYISDGTQCIEDTPSACENVTCSGVGTCVGSSIFTNRFGDGRQDELNDLTVDSDGYIGLGGFTGLEDDSQLFAVIKDPLFSDVLSYQNNESISNELQSITSFGTTFYLLIQSDSQKILSIDHFGVPFAEVELTVPYGVSYIEAAPDGNIIIAGKASETELHVSKIAPDGTQIWDETITSTTVQSMRIEDVSVYSNGEIAVVGTVEGELFSTSIGSRDLFIVNYNSAGVANWSVQLGTDSGDQDPAISFDNNGDIIITFITEGAFSGANLGFMDAAVAKFSGIDGTELWRTQFGTAAFDAPFDIAVSPEDQIFVVGATLGSMSGNINEGAGIYGMNTADIFVTELDGNGTEYSTFTYGDIPHDWFAEKIEAVGDNVVYLAGNTGHLDFEEGIMFSDMFLLKVDLLERDNYPQCDCPEGYNSINNECVEEESCSNLNCGDFGICEVKNLRAMCFCDEGYKFDGITCIEDVNLCEGVDCSGNGQCEVVDDAPVCNCNENYTNDGDVFQCINEKNAMCVEGLSPQNATVIFEEFPIWYDDYNGWSQPSICPWECDYGYDIDYNLWECVNRKAVSCTMGITPENAFSNYYDVEIFYDPITGWSTPEECIWNCHWGYVSDDGETCINQKDVTCVENTPDNAATTETSVTVFYDPDVKAWPDAGECPWECNLDYDLFSPAWGTDSCINERDYPCTYFSNLPENAFFTGEMYRTATYTTAGGWLFPESCEWECEYGYISEDGITCINYQIIDCVPDPAMPENANSISRDVFIHYYPETGWSETPVCEWVCADNYISEDGVTCINEKYVSCAGPPENATSVEPYLVPIAYTTTGGWADPERCTWSCNENYVQVGDTCAPGTKTVECENVKPDNSVWTDPVDGIVFQTWSGTAWLPSEYDCVFECITDYISEDGGQTCINIKQIPCADPPENATATTVYDVTVTYTTANGWTEAEICPWECNMNFTQVSDMCEADTRNVACQNTKPEITIWADENPDGHVFQTWSGSQWLPSENECVWECENGYYYNEECTEGLPPFEPSNPMPYNSEINVSFDANVILSWDGGDPLGESVVYTVKYGTELPPETVVCRDVNTESCTVGHPIHGKDYFWQVVATNSSGRFITGPIWHFTAEIDGTDSAPVWPGETYIYSERIGSAGAELRWTPAIDDNKIEKYNVYVNDKPFGSYSPAQLEVVEENGTTLFSATIIPLVDETVYNFRVEACDISRCTENGLSVIAETIAIENTVTQYEFLDASNFIKMVDRFKSYYRTTENTEPIQHFVKITPDNDYSPILVDNISVVEGEVKDSLGNGMSDVLVYVKDHPEFGYTYTRSGDDAGKWSIVLNSGKPYVFVISKPGYLPIQRVAFPEPEMVQFVDTVVLITEPETLGSINTTLDISQSVETTSHNDDGRGERKALIVINPDTEVYAVYNDDVKIQLDTITIGHTEYTRGNEGVNAMPAPLPQNIGYTYCAELVVEEVPDANEVIFTRPIYYYLDNFLNFPVGTAVPNGRFDRKENRWVAEKDGVVISVVSIKTLVDGTELAEIDIDGDGLPESSGDLFNQIEITNSELELLAQRYGEEIINTGPKQLWRAPIVHFSPRDLNLFVGIEDGAVAPKMIADSDESDPNDMNCPSGTTGSQIECESRILGERINIPGTGYTLHYRSDSSGRLASKKVRITLQNGDEYDGDPVIAASMPNAGSVTGGWDSSNEYTAVWDGNDRHGNSYNGTQNIKVRVSYLYPGRYQCAGYSKGAESFSSLQGGFITVGDSNSGGGGGDSVGNQEPCGYAGMQALSASKTIKLYNHDTKPGGLGGLTLDVSSKYDRDKERLYRGDGTVHSVEDYLENIITSVDGNYTSLGKITSLPTGEIVFYGHNYKGYLFKIKQDGSVEAIAGGGSEDYKNGMSPLDASIYVSGLTTDASGRIYFTDGTKDRILMIDTDGLLYVIAGTGGSVPPDTILGDGLPANEAAIQNPSSITVSSNGTIYFSSDSTIRYIDQNRILHSLLPIYMGATGGVRWSASIDLELTLDEKMLIFSGINSYSYSSNVVGKVNLEGTPEVTFLFGNSSQPATIIDFYDLHPVGTSEDLKFYYSNNSKIEYYDNGSRTAFIGSSIGDEGDGELVKNAKFSKYLHMTFANNGRIFISDGGNWRIRKVGPESSNQVVGSFMIPDAVTGNILSFDHFGRHLSTVDSVTGFVLHSFSYELDTVPGMDDYVGTILSSVTDIDGDQTVFDRSDPESIRIVSPDGDESFVVLNEKGMASQFINPDGSSYYFEYSETSGGSLLNKIIYPNGVYTDYTYDSDGRLKKVIDQKTTEVQPYKQFSSLETSSSNEWRTLYETIEGKETVYVYTDNESAVDRSVTRPDGTVTTVNYVKTQGKITRNENGGDIQTTIYETEDPRFGYHLPYVESHTVQTGTYSMSVTRNKSAALTNPSDPLSHETLTDTTTINGKTWTNHYSDTEKSWTFTTPESRTSKRYINDKGRTALIENPDIENVSFTYRTDGKIETISQGTGTEERLLTIAYYNTTDEASGALKGEVSTIIDPMNRTVDFEYDLMGRVLKKTFEKSTVDERIVEYSYDESGNVLTVKPAGKPVHNFYYDSVDLPDIYEAPLATGLTEEERRTEYTYNLDRQVEDIVRPDGTVIHLTYELTKEGYAQSTGKLQKITVPGRGDIELDYETTGGKKLSTVTTPEGDTLTYAYDGALMTDETWSGNVTGTVSRTYNNDFQTTAVTVGSNTTGYNYDNDGLLLSSGDMTITRDPESGLVTGTALDSLTTTQTYNTFGEIETYDAGDYSYTIVSRDKLGRITEKDETIQGITTTYEYTYDKAGRLETVTENELLINQYTYDDNGNRTSKNGITATHDQQDRLIQDGYSSYTYTANGDLETKVNALGTTTYTHDALGNLTQVNLPNNDVISYTYDGRNRMISKTVNGTVEYRLIYAGQLSPIAKVDATGTVLETYVYGLGVNSPDYIIKDGTQYRVIKDHLGSMRMIVDSTTETIEKSVTYDEFGNITNETGTFDTIFGYAGGIRDTDTGLTKFGARWYDPVTGRWIEKEPLGFNGSDNFYSYVDGDPVNWVDVSGLKRTKNYNDAVKEAADKIIKHLKDGGNNSIEHSVTVYRDKDGFYDITKVKPGLDKGIYPELTNLPNNGVPIAVVHFHTVNPNYSPQDQRDATRKSLQYFVVAKDKESGVFAITDNCAPDEEKAFLKFIRKKLGLDK